MDQPRHHSFRSLFPFCIEFRTFENPPKAEKEDRNRLSFNERLSALHFPAAMSKLSFSFWSSKALNAKDTIRDL